eukprot:scaffold816_cov139-Isochrysis_galbana.AAC.3
MDGRFLLLVFGFAPCPVLPFEREKARQLLSVIVLGVTLATKVPVGPSFLFPQASWSYTLSQSVNQSISLMSISSYASDLSAASHSHSCEFTLSPTRHLNRAWFSPLSMRCLRPCAPPVRLFSVYSLRVQPSIRQ